MGDEESQTLLDHQGYSTRADDPSILIFISRLVTLFGIFSPWFWFVRMWYATTHEEKVCSNVADPLAAMGITMILMIPLIFSIWMCFQTIKDLLTCPFSLYGDLKISSCLAYWTKIACGSTVIICAEMYLRAIPENVSDDNPKQCIIYWPVVILGIVVTVFGLGQMPKM